MVYYFGAMKIWLSKNSEVPLREQLVTQVRLGVVSGDLLPGEKLPSTREIARRFGVHPNTVSAAYRELAASGHVDQKKGSGIYVSKAAANGHGDQLDGLIEKFVSDAALLGFKRSDIIGRLVTRRDRLSRGFLLVEPNPDLREIVIEEVSFATGLPVRAISDKEIAGFSGDEFQLIAMFDEEAKLSQILGSDRKCIYLKANSVASSLTGRNRPTEGELIVVASAWNDFLVLARLFLLAAKIDPNSIVTCSRREDDWGKTIRNAALIICDSATAKLLDGDDRVLPFQLIAERSLDELRSLSR